MPRPQPLPSASASRDVKINRQVERRDFHRADARTAAAALRLHLCMQEASCVHSSESEAQIPAGTGSTHAMVCASACGGEDSEDGVCGGVRAEMEVFARTDGEVCVCEGGCDGSVSACVGEAAQLPPPCLLRSAERVRSRAFEVRMIIHDYAWRRLITHHRT
eukprot:3070430-Pleurochrysis_carterae.AAC.2